MNNSSANIKSLKTQLSRMVQLEGLICEFWCLPSCYANPVEITKLLKKSKHIQFKMKNHGKQEDNAHQKWDKKTVQQ